MHRREDRRHHEQHIDKVAVSGVILWVAGMVASIAVAARYSAGWFGALACATFGGVFGVFAVQGGLALAMLLCVVAGPGLGIGATVVAGREGSLGPRRS